jgi:hypothetical protein
VQENATIVLMPNEAITTGDGLSSVAAARAATTPPTGNGR